ncbi:MAG: hypothetical protein QOF14_3964 [Hyphomicrobiales bacterium]|jgi:hypothetical protein|nr:hypothetical protein [Hyphomicrobiales bacterium]
MRSASALAVLALCSILSPAHAQQSENGGWIGSGVTGFQEPVRPQTPSLSAANNSNPVYAPGLTAQQLLDRAMPYLDASDAVYGLKPLNGVKPQDWQSFFPGGLAKLSPEMRKLIDASGFHAGVYFVGQQPVLAFAGTDLGTSPMKDLRTNLENLIQGGRADARALYQFLRLGDVDATKYQSIQNQLALAVATAVKERYPNVILTGHSLGGEQAAHAGAAIKSPAVTFNASGAHFSSGQNADPKYVLNFVIKEQIAERSGKPTGNTISFDPQLTNSPFKNAAGPGIVGGAGRNTVAVAKEVHLHFLQRFREINANLKNDPGSGFTSLRTGNDGYADYLVGKNAPVVTPTLQQALRQQPVVPQPQIIAPAPDAVPAAPSKVAVPAATATPAVPKPQVSAAGPIAPAQTIAAASKAAAASAPKPNAAPVVAQPTLNAKTAAPNNIATMAMPPAPQTEVRAPLQMPAPTHAGITGFDIQTRPVSAVYRPGGISLSKAAAERMALNVDLEGLHYSNGQIILSGRPNAGNSIDAALFLTAVRTACEATDPFFSLDPDNGSAWLEQGRASVKSMWDRLRGDFTWTPNVPANRGRNATIPDGLTMRTISVRRDMARAWAQAERGYPDLKTRLVFRPEWLRETRFGKILYKADVLLKELTSGVSIVDPATPLRATKVGGYVAPHMRGVVGGVFDSGRDGEFKGHRLWFDLMPQGPARADSAPAPMPVLDASRNPVLYSQLLRKGYIGTSAATPIKAAIFHDDSTIDLTQVYPKMFVRRHDHATGRDITGTDAYLSLLSSDVNARTDRYAAAYKELRELTEIFRAYVASVKVVRQDTEICGSVRTMPLFDAEKTLTPLPLFHPSELFINVVRYVSRQGNKRMLSLNSGTSVSGGIALRGREFYDASAITMETKVIADLKRELGAPIAPTTVPQPVWKGESGRQYIALNVFEHTPAATMGQSR